MRRLFDYRCPSCGWAGERLEEVPAPRAAACGRCPGEALRRYTTAGLRRTGDALAAIAPAAGSTACRDNPDVPGLCHVAPAARRSLIARHRGDDDTLAAERARQTRRYELDGPVPLEQVLHTHGHPHPAGAPNPQRAEPRP